MSEFLLYGLTAMLIFGAVGGAGWAFSGGMSGQAQKRVAAVAKVEASSRFGLFRGNQDVSGQRRKNVTALLKEIEKKKEAQKERPTLRRRLTRAGLTIEPRSFWLFSAAAAVGALLLAFFFGYPWYANVGIAFTAGLGLPRWVVSFSPRAARKNSPRNSPPPST